LLSLAQRDAQDGKAGAAYGSICQAIDGFDSAASTFSCTHKLIGDLYSFGASLPPGVFDSSAETDILQQIAFVAHGESFYQAASAIFVSEDENESKVFRAAFITDAGTNILHQSHLTSCQKCKGLSCNSTKCEAVSALYKRASLQFRSAIELCPEYAPAWCGLGCSMVFSDPLLAQHCFCRSLELDSFAPDAYSNLGFLYTAHNAYNASNGVLDALTQVADSPMMWINRALILERTAASDIRNGERRMAKERMSQAADAYRAAIQVVKHPSAMLGLSLTCRASSGTPDTLTTSMGVSAFQDSYGYMLQYRGKMGDYNASAALLEDIASLEIGINSVSDDASHVRDLMASVKKDLDAIETLRRELQPDALTCLDLDVINDCLSSDAIAREDEKEEASSESVRIGMPLARQIVHEPHRGDLWVEFAKQLLRDNNGSREGIKSAQVAACRAVHILTHQLGFPNQQQQLEGTHKVVDPKNLSDALALSHWLDNLAPRPPPDEAMALTATATVCRTLELQKALMMDPNNKFAREALSVRVGKD
jgi:tetratricopeptide (TPR) repeat protein